MTLEELADHTANVRDRLEAKRHLARDGRMDPGSRAFLLSQIAALEGRTDELEKGCAELLRRRSGPVPAVL